MRRDNFCGGTISLAMAKRRARRQRARATDCLTSTCVAAAVAAFGRRPPRRRGNVGLASRGRLSGLDASPQRVHEIDDLGGLAVLRPLDRLAGLLLLDQILESSFVVVLEFFRIEDRKSTR